MKNIKDWTDKLAALYAAQEEGTIKPAQAMEMNNTAGKVVSFLKLQLEYNKSRQQTGNKLAQIEMLETPSK